MLSNLIETKIKDTKEADKGAGMVGETQTTKTLGKGNIKSLKEIDKEIDMVEETLTIKTLGRIRDPKGGSISRAIDSIVTIAKHVMIEGKDVMIGGKRTVSTKGERAEENSIKNTPMISQNKNILASDRPTRGQATKEGIRNLSIHSRSLLALVLTPSSPNGMSLSSPSRRSQEKSPSYPRRNQSRALQGLSKSKILRNLKLQGEDVM